MHSNKANNPLKSLTESSPEPAPALISLQPAQDYEGGDQKEDFSVSEEINDNDTEHPQFIQSEDEESSIALQSADNIGISAKLSAKQLDLEYSSSPTIAVHFIILPVLLLLSRVVS